MACEKDSWGISGRSNEEQNVNCMKDGICEPCEYGGQDGGDVMGI